MIFNRGNKIINADFKVGTTSIENVKSFLYLGFVISAKNCQFQTTIDDLSLKANRAIFSIRSRFKLSSLPTKLAIKIFNSQIVPILLYGSEVWGPYMGHDFKTWDSSKIERTQTKFLKQILGCNFQTSNFMIRGDTGCRPLITQVITRYITYIQNIKITPSKLSHDAYSFEIESLDTPNFLRFLEKFNIDEGIALKSKEEIKNICKGTYDMYWSENIVNSSKAASYNKFKSDIKIDTYLVQNLHPNIRIALSRFRLSNHALMIEKGRHVRPKVDRDKRFCNFCKIEIEDETHFLLLCPLYSPKRTVLQNACRINCSRFDSLTNGQKFIFIMSNENETILKTLSKFIYDSTILREKMMEYFFS